jgi:hypothetical protein
VVTRHSVGDQKQIFGGIGQDHVQKLPILRVVVTVAAALLTAFAYQRTKSFSVWIGLFLVVAAVFNPIVPLHLTQGVVNFKYRGGSVIRRALCR